jgi:hypothetical protein
MADTPSARYLDHDDAEPGPRALYVQPDFRLVVERDLFRRHSKAIPRRLPETGAGSMSNYPPSNKPGNRKCKRDKSYRDAAAGMLNEA